MIFDSSLRFSSLQAVTATAASDNVVDFGSSADMGIGDDPLAIVCVVTTAFAAAGAATLQVQFQTSADNAAWTTLVQSDAVAVAELTAGAELLRSPVPAGLRRYVRLNYVVASGPMTAGALSAMLAGDRQANTAYPSGTTVDN